MRGFMVLLFCLATTPVRADKCTVLQGNSVTQMCGSFAYSDQGANKFTINFGPGTTFGVVGVPGTGTAGITGYGTFQCRGDNFYTTQYTANNGTAPMWYARLPGPAAGYDTETPAIFVVTLKADACQGQ